MHLKGHSSINLVVLVVILLLDGEKFLIREDVFVPILSVPLEETLCSCPSDLLQSRSKEVLLRAEMHSHV
jgi:hypothetical protein